MSRPPKFNIVTDDFMEVAEHVKLAVLHGGICAVYVDDAGATQTLSGSAYTLETSIWPFYVLPAYLTDWPDTRDQANAVTVRYTLGYDATTKVPGDIRGWLLMTVAFLFAQREAMVVDGRVSEIPNRYTDSMLDPYRVFRV